MSSRIFSWWRWTRPEKLTDRLGHPEHHARTLPDGALKLQTVTAVAAFGNAGAAP